MLRQLFLSTTSRSTSNCAKSGFAVPLLASARRYLSDRHGAGDIAKVSKGSQNGSESEEGIPLLNDQVRSAMRKVPHPLVIITAAMGNDPRDGHTGLLVSSFNTVTMDPEPMVSFNIKIPSSTYEAISKTGQFEVSAVWHEPTARAFAKGLHGQQTWRSLPPKDDANMSSLAEKRVFALHCEWLRKKSVDVGDHIIMVGRILEYVPPLPNRERASILVYSEGEYRWVSAPSWLVKSRQMKAEDRQRELELATMTKR